jgi:hypothetical protein
VWAEAQSLTSQQQRLRGLMFSLESHEDVPRVSRAAARLALETNTRYRDLRRTVQRDWRLRLDGLTGGLRSAIVAALSNPDDARLRADVEVRLRIGRDRWGGAEPRVSAPHLTSADAEIGRMRHYVDRPTGVTLLTGTGDGFLELDLDHSRRRPVVAPGISADAPVNRMVVRDGWVAFNDAGQQGWIASDRLGPPLVPIGTGFVLPSPRPDAIWFWSNLDSVIELDRSGAVLAGPYRLTLDATREEFRVVGVAPAGVVVRRDEKGVTEVLDRSSGRVLRRLPGLAAAAHGNLVAWTDAGETNTTHVTDVGTGAELAAVNAGYPVTAAFSQDGHQLALAGYDVNVVNVTTGRVQLVYDRAGAEQLAWDPSGRWLFFQGAVVTGWDALLHEVFHPRLPPIRGDYVLLAALAR